MQNQNHNEVSPHSSQSGHHQKHLQTTDAGEGVEKREPSCTVGGNVNWYSHYGEQYRDSLKIQEIVKDREACHAAWGHEESDTT